ncbi:hypothetical protein HMPREF3196_01087 [Bifidobacterium bifidum]|uniref:Uncharacterized protein n=1 Tax=Bifidobacterium bifidum TaxID=1681 RepID=A0A133KP32_BIFBI|nr:hypothetical protein HMPREF3196_01087 [Bifidobacterium bifidum]
MPCFGVTLCGYRHAVRVRGVTVSWKPLETLGFVVPSLCARAHTVTVPAQRDATAAIARCRPSSPPLASGC